MCLHIWTAHLNLADLVFCLTASMCSFQLKFMADVHYEVARISTLHSANVSITVMYFYFTSKIKSWFVIFYVSSLQNLILLPKATLFILVVMHDAFIKLKMF